MKILFLTTHNLATNPRLVKEIQLALNNSFVVEVICFKFRNWSYLLNEEILNDFKTKGVQFHCLEAGKQDFKNWAFSVLKEKISRILSKVFSINTNSLAYAISRRNFGLLETLEKIKSADWVIGHNPGALMATYVAGEKLNCKTGFDVEDYHPGEGNDTHQQKLARKLMQQLLPKMDYVSFASPLIMKEVKKDVNKSYQNWFTILNYFPKEEFLKPNIDIDGKLKLVWFSQNINAGRGLELILPTVKDNPLKMELHLYGNINNDFKEEHLLAENIFIHEPLPQNKLHQELGLYDVGLALEPAKDLNNDLALSNKILAYLQSGLYILGTDTAAQKSFLDTCKHAGIYFDHKINDSADVLNMLEKNLNTIRENRLTRFEFNDNNWERESLKLLNILNTQ